MKEAPDRPLKCQSIFDGIYDVESPGKRSNFPPAPNNMVDFRDGKKLVAGSRFFDSIKDAADGHENYSNVAYARHVAGKSSETWIPHCPPVITHDGFVKMLIATHGKIDTKF